MMGSIPYDSICGVSYLSNIHCKHFQSNFAEIKQVLKGYNCFLTRDRNILRRKKSSAPFPPNDFIVFWIVGICCGKKVCCTSELLCLSGSLSLQFRM